MADIYIIGKDIASIEQRLARLEAFIEQGLKEAAELAKEKDTGVK